MQLLVAGAMLLVFIFIMLSIWLGVPGVFHYGVGLATFGLFLLVFHVTARRAHREVVGIILADGLCPACAYSLRDVPVEQDGCATCPECGSAWRAEGIRRYIDPPDLAAMGHPRLGRWLERLGNAGSSRSLKDDQGVVQSMVGVRDLKMAREQATPEPATRLRGALAALRPRGRLRRLAGGGFVLLLALAVLPSLGTDPMALLQSGPTGLGLFVFVLFGVVFAAAIFVSDAGRAPTVVRRVLLEHSLCPGCASDLLDVEPNSDGCTVCPECGAAWKLEEEPRG